MQRSPTGIIESASIGWRLCLALGLLAGSAGRVEAQPDARSKQVDDLIHKYVHNDGPGMAVVVVKDGKVVHKQGYGLANIDKNVKITPQTTFELASVSKQFTGMAMMVLHDQGKLSFDDDVRNFLPRVPVFNPNRPVRIRDMLHHTAGLPDYPCSLSNNDQIYHWLSGQRKLLFPTGRKFEYENTDYAMLALVAQAASKKPFHVFMREEVFGKLGMTKTLAFQDPKTRPERAAFGYGRRKKLKDFEGDESVQKIYEMTKRGNFRRVDQDTLIVGDGSVWSNLDDLALWGQAVLGRKLVKADTWKEALTGGHLDDGTLVKEDGDGYGFGWWLHKGKKGGGEVIVLYHGGSWDGYSTLDTAYLRDKMFIAILSNIWHLNLYQIRNEIRDIYVK